MLETDIDLIRDWIVLIVLGVSAISGLVLVAFIAVFIVRVKNLLDLVKRIMDDMRLASDFMKGEVDNGC